MYRRLIVMVALVGAIGFALAADISALTALAPQDATAGKMTIEEIARQKAMMPAIQAPAVEPELDRAGGPDAFGYYFKDETETGGPTYNWIDISSSGTNVPFPSYDDNYANISIGFTFNFYGTNYTDVYVGTNGFLTFGAGSSSLSNTTIPSAGAPNNLVAGFWDDLNGQTAAAVKYQVMGTAPNRYLVISFNTYRYGYYTNHVVFEFVLYEGSNDIVVQYQSTYVGYTGYDYGYSATAGIENGTGTVGLLYSYNEAVLNANRAIKYYIPAGSPDDVGIEDVWMDKYTTAEGDAQVVNCRIKNFGSNAQSSIPLFYNAGGSNVNQTWSGSLAPGASTDFAFTTTWTPTSVGSQDITCATLKSGDPDNSNDTLVETIPVWPAGTRVGQLFNGATFPPLGWTSAILVSTYNWERFTVGIYPTINPLEGAAMTGFRSFSTSTGEARLVSHPWTVGSSAELIRCRFYMYGDPGYAGSDDRVVVEYSTDSTNWTRVDSFSRYNATPGWYQKELAINAFSPGARVFIGFHAISEYGNNMFVDSLRIYAAAANDVALKSIDVPAGIFGVNEDFYPEVTIQNAGSQPQSNIPVTLEIYDGATPVYSQTEYYTGPLAGGAEDQVVFSTAFNTGYVGKGFSVVSYTALTGDENPANDTLNGAFSVATLEWFSLNPAGTAVYRPAGCSDSSGGFWVIGGNNGPNLMQRYDIAAGTWSNKAGLPGAGRTNEAAAFNAVTNCIYVVGGSDGTSSYNTILIYDIATNQWSTSPTTLPQTMRNLSAASAGNKVYILGGYNDIALTTHGDELYEFDVNTGVLTTLTPCPYTTDYYNFGSMTHLDGVLYAALGLNDIGDYDNSFVSYDIATATWTALPRFAGVRLDPPLVPMNDKVFLLGGMYPVWNGIPSTDPNQVQVFDPANPTMGWVGETPMVYGNGAGAVGEGSLLQACGYTTTAVTTAQAGEAPPPPVVGGDVGVTGIVAPVGRYDTSATVTPTATWKNYYTETADFSAWMTLSDPTDAVVYTEQVDVTGLAAGAETTLVFPDFNVGTIEGAWAVACSTFAAGDTYAANDLLTGAFSVATRPPWADRWTEATPMPLLPSSKAVKRGGWLAMGPEGLIYATKGYKTGDFYRYDAFADTWTILAEVQPGVEGKLPEKGCRGASDGVNSLYMTKGNNTFGFWGYDIAANTWAPLTDVPAGPTGKKVKGGTDLVYVPTGDSAGYVYMLKGYKTEFWRFDPATGVWEARSNAPIGVKEKWDKGSWLAYDGENTIYAHKAKYYTGANHEMWKYDIPGDSWSGPLKGMPLSGLHSGRIKSKKAKDGSAGAYFDGMIYALKGGNTQQFYAYDVAADTWTESDTVPTYGSTGKKKRVKTGADLVHWGGGAFFALKGNKTLEMWRYVVPAAMAKPERSGVMAGTLKAGRVGIQLGPNPLVGGLATLRYSLPKAGPATVTVYDATGRTVLRFSAPASRHSTLPVDLRKVPAGIYLVKVEADGFTGTQKLVIQH